MNKRQINKLIDDSEKLAIQFHISHGTANDDEDVIQTEIEFCNALRERIDKVYSKRKK